MRPTSAPPAPAEVKDRVLKEGKLAMPFFYKIFGEKPKGGRSLWISMHGGGNAPAAVNDSQYENQKRLYQLAEGIYLAPRAPTNTWNLWHEAHIDRFFTRLIEDLVVLEDVDPDRVYVMGYSAGGDGVYQLAPRMADSWAAAAMMGGHPNGVSLLSLRNVPFALQVGANDGAYNRNKVAREYGEQLDKLQKDDPDGLPALRPHPRGDGALDEPRGQGGPALDGEVHAQPRPREGRLETDGGPARPLVLAGRSQGQGGGRCPGGRRAQGPKDHASTRWRRSAGCSCVSTTACWTWTSR